MQAMPAYVMDEGRAAPATAHCSRVPPGLLVPPVLSVPCPRPYLVR